MNIAKVAGAVLLFTQTWGSAADKPDHKLLPTAALAREISALQTPNGNRVLRLANVQREIGSFVLRQIEAYPSILDCELQQQLAAAFGIKGNDCRDCELSDAAAPRIFATSSGPNSVRRVFVVAYCVWLGFHGEGGYETVLASYVWERGSGVRRGTRLTPVALSGIRTGMEQVCWFPDPDRFWVLASGTMSGGSGQVLGGNAAVFEIGPEYAKAVWSAAPGIGNVKAHAHRLDLRWEIEYADARRFYARLPGATLLDIYQVDFATHTYRRLVHQPLD